MPPRATTAVTASPKWPRTSSARSPPPSTTARSNGGRPSRSVIANAPVGGDHPRSVGASEEQGRVVPSRRDHHVPRTDLDTAGGFLEAEEGEPRLGRAGGRWQERDGGAGRRSAPGTGGGSSCRSSSSGRRPASTSRAATSRPAVPGPDDRHVDRLTNGSLYQRRRGTEVRYGAEPGEASYDPMVGTDRERRSAESVERVDTSREENVQHPEQVEARGRPGVLGRDRTSTSLGRYRHARTFGRPLTRTRQPVQYPTPQAGPRGR